MQSSFSCLEPKRQIRFKQQLYFFWSTSSQNSDFAPSVFDDMDQSCLLQNIVSKAYISPIQDQIAVLYWVQCLYTSTRTHCNFTPFGKMVTKCKDQVPNYANSFGTVSSNQCSIGPWWSSLSTSSIHKEGLHYCLKSIKVNRCITRDHGGVRDPKGAR